jgi:hypothetical protein
MLGRVLNRASAMGSFRSRATLETDGLGRAPREEPHHTDGERADGRHLSRAGGSEYVPSVPGFADTHLLPTPGVKKCHLSFLSKYLHGCVNDAFPIWDQNARTALNNDNDERSWLSYRNWVVCVRQEAATHKACCLEQIQLPGECLLRTFDKALYILGGEVAERKQDNKRESRLGKVHGE